MDDIVEVGREKAGLIYEESTSMSRSNLQLLNRMTNGLPIPGLPVGTTLHCSALSNPVFREDAEGYRNSEVLHRTAGWGKASCQMEGEITKKWRTHSMVLT